MMASIRSSSQYDAITSNDLFDSFMSVVAENELEHKENGGKNENGHLSIEINAANNIEFQHQDVYAVVEKSRHVSVARTQSTPSPVQTKRIINNISIIPNNLASNLDTDLNLSKTNSLPLNANPKTPAISKIRSNQVSATFDTEVNIPPKDYNIEVKMSPRLAHEKINESGNKNNIYESANHNFYESIDMNGPGKPERIFKAEEVAFSAHKSKDQFSNSIHNTCIETIEKQNKASSSSFHKSPSAKDKKNFFGFGKAKDDIKNRKQQWSAVTESDYQKETMEKEEKAVPVLCDGFLFKQGGTGFTPKNWRLRWFELKKDNCLYYYKSQQDHVPSGAVMLFKYIISRAPEVNKRFAFKLVKGNARSYYFAAYSNEEMQKWMKHFSESSKNGFSEHTTIPECSLKNVSIPALSISIPDCHGYLYKQGNFHKSWKKRYCVMKYACLFYYEDISDKVAIGVFKLHNYHVQPSKNIRYGIETVPPSHKLRTYYFYTDTEIDWKRWLQAMRHSIQTYK